MATHRKKVVEVEARKYEGTASLTVMHDVKGEQRAKAGDWLVGNEKGQIEVVKDADFQRDYEAIPEPIIPENPEVPADEKPTDTTTHQE